MENNELQHWGIKGMRWGIRRFQKKDGSLTPAGKKRYDNDGDKKELTPEEDIAQKRARLLKSTDAKELYDNRHLLSTNEINERINRIDTEKRLADKIPKEEKKTAMDRVDTVLKVGQKVNEVYNFMNTPMMKAVRKKMFGEEVPEKESFNLGKIYKNKDKLSDNELSAALKRANTEKAIKKILDDEAAKVASEQAKKAAEAGKAYVDEILKNSVPLLPAPKDD